MLVFAGIIFACGLCFFVYGACQCFKMQETQQLVIDAEYEQQQRRKQSRRKYLRRG